MITPIALVIIANGISLGAVLGLIFLMLIQPRRNAINGWFSLFLTALGVWAYFALARHVDDLSPFDETQSFYMLFTGLIVTPMTLYAFVWALCRPPQRLWRLLVIWSPVFTLVLFVLLWAGYAVDYHRDDTLGFTLYPAGYLALAHAVFYSLFSYHVLTQSDKPQAAVLRWPPVLLLIGYGSNVIEPLRAVPFDISLTTVAAVWIGYAVLRWQLFTPLQETNDQLIAANTELRMAIHDLAAEKERTELLNQELREANRYKSEFLTNMSHELRTPLNSIVGYSELMLKGIYGDLNDKQSDRIEKIHRNGLNLLALINDILDLSRIEGGRLELSVSTVRLKPLAEALMATVEPLVGSKNLALHLDLEHPLRLLRADELRVRQVLLNLLSNAVKFTPGGSVTLRACNVTVKDGCSADFDLPLRGWLPDRHWVIASVEDTGIGIPPEEQALIFEEFRQADGTVTRQYEGAGLGLAIARRLVELHSGRIWVNSRPDEGSTFYVALPALEDFDQPACSTQPSVERSDRPYVLVVEDNDEAASILTDALQNLDCRVLRVADVQAAVRRLTEFSPAAVLVDVLMPNMAGWDVIKHLKSNGIANHTPEHKASTLSASAVPVVLVSVLDQQPTGFKLGHTACIARPVQRDDLLAALDQLQVQRFERPVIVIDDAPDERERICTMLREAAHAVAQCDDGKKALQWLDQPQNIPSLVVLNLFMPGISGLEVLHRLRSQPQYAEVPVILVVNPQPTEADSMALYDHITRILRHSAAPQRDLQNLLAGVLNPA